MIHVMMDINERQDQTYTFVTIMDATYIYVRNVLSLIVNYTGQDKQTKNVYSIIYTSVDKYDISLCIHINYIRFAL